MARLRKYGTGEHVQTLTPAVRIINRINNIRRWVNGFLFRFYKRVTATLVAHPERSFFSLIGVIFLFIIIGSVFNQPPKQKTQTPPPPLPVSVYNVGSSPKITLTATVEKSGVINLVAQSAGIIQSVYKNPGETVLRGDWLFWISTNYQGGTLPSVSRQIAQKNADFTQSNYAAQKDMIVRQRNLADLAKGQADKLRDITNQSLADTQAAISADQDILNTLNSQISSLETANTDHGNDALILQAKQGAAGILAGLTSLNSASRSAQYQAGNSNEPAQISQNQHDLTIEQLDVQDKSVDLNLELAKLNLQIAQIAESLMYPASPVTGIIERIHVKVGQNVNPGTVLATITGNTTTATAVITLPKSITDRISRIEKSTLHIGSQTYEVTPQYVSREATDGLLNTVLYAIPPDAVSGLTDGAGITVDVPVGSIDTNSVIPNIPLDALFQTQQDAYVFVTKSDGKSVTAQSRKVTPGTVYGDFVEIPRGLKDGDHIILDRSVIDGEKVKIKE